jgi:pimeloyl-ACP methyl ester carboxylesterase
MPVLLGHAHGQPSGVALVFQGGRVRSQMRSRGYQLASLRMIPFARTIARDGRDVDVAAFRLRYRFRGWNSPDPSIEPDPVRDARWALEEIQRRYGDVPVVLVGHSMGGRVAFRVADSPRVAGVVTLAPWCDPTDPVIQLAGQDVLIAHGTRDRITSPQGSLIFARRAQGIGAEVRRIEIEGGTHAMLRRASLWHGLASGYVLRRLGHPGPDPSGALSAPNPTGGRRGAAVDPLRLRV